jgi:hypothetical protein
LVPTQTRPSGARETDHTMRFGQAFGAAVAPRPAVPHARNALPLAAQPQVAFAILVAAYHALEGAGTGFGHELRQRAVAKARQPGVAARPQVVFVVLDQHGDRRVLQSFGIGRQPPGIALAQVQAGAGAGPDAALRFRQPGDGRPRRFRRQGQELRAGIGSIRCGHAIDAAEAADPQSVITPQQGLRRRRTAGAPHQAAAARFEHAAAGGHGNALRVFDHRVDVEHRVTRGIGGRHGAEHAVLPHGQALVGADPHAPGLVDQQRARPDAGQFRRVLQVVGGEAHAIEARRSRLGADPDVALVVLRDRLHADLRQALADRPGVEDVVVEGLARIQRLRGHSRQQSGQGQQQCEEAAVVCRRGAHGAQPTSAGVGSRVKYCAIGSGRWMP